MRHVRCIPNGTLKMPIKMGWSNSRCSPRFSDSQYRPRPALSRQNILRGRSPPTATFDPLESRVCEADIATAVGWAWIYSGIVENMRKTPIFVLAGFMAIFEALIVALAPHRIFADEAAMPVKDGMAPRRTKRVMLVVDRSREFGAAAVRRRPRASPNAQRTARSSRSCYFGTGR